MWEGVPQQQLLTRLVHGEYPGSPKLKRPEMHEELDRICQKALSFDPSDRYPTAAALQEDIENFVAEHEKRPSPRQLGASPPALRRNRSTLERSSRSSSPS
jgi:eukaryotic-like serine/threonine-protein kinase